MKEERKKTNKKGKQNNTTWVWAKLKENLFWPNHKQMKNKIQFWTWPTTCIGAGQT